MNVAFDLVDAIVGQEHVLKSNHPWKVAQNAKIIIAEIDCVI